VTSEMIIDHDDDDVDDDSKMANNFCYLYTLYTLYA